CVTKVKKSDTHTHKMIPGRSKIVEKFQKACKMDDFTRARTIADENVLTRAEAQSDSYAAFHSSCKRGLINTAQWLFERFGPIENRQDLRKIFQSACRSENLILVQWITTTFSITREDVVSDDYRAFECACS